MENWKLLSGRIGLNVLAKNAANAKEVQEAAEGVALIGVTAKDYATIDEAVEKISEIRDAAGRVSVGLGAGDPTQWQKVVDIAARVKPQHVNQVFPVAAYTHAYLKALGLNPVVNALVSPTGKPGIVKISTGPLSEQATSAEVEAKTALLMLKEAGLQSVKFFPVQGSKRLDEIAVLARTAAEVGIPIFEPTGGIDESNFEVLLRTCLDSGVKVVVPHVYTAIIDKTTGLTRPSSVANLIAIARRLLD